MEENKTTLAVESECGCAATGDTCHCAEKKDAEKVCACAEQEEKTCCCNADKGEEAGCDAVREGDDCGCGDANCHCGETCTCTEENNCGCTCWQDKNDGTKGDDCGCGDANCHCGETCTCTEENNCGCTCWKDKEKKPRSIKGLVEYIKSHESLRQLVLFMLFSFLCCAGQLITQYVLIFALGTANLGPANNMWIFTNTDSNGMASFIGYLCGSVVGQVLTFVLNRKKTFHATNNVAIAGCMYAVIAAIIIIANTSICNSMQAVTQSAILANGNAVLDAAGKLPGIWAVLATLPGTVLGGLASFLISFFGNKYLVMRDWKKKAE